MFQDPDGLNGPSAADIWFNQFAVDVGWATPTLIESNSDLGEASQPQLAMDVGGNATAVWSQEDPGEEPEWSVWANHFAASTGWGTPEIIDSNALDAGSPKVARGNSGNAIVVWAQSDGVRLNIWARRYDVTIGWATAGVIESQADGARAPVVAMDVAGNAVVVWQQHDGTRFNIMSRVYDLAEGWGSTELVEHDNSGDARDPQVELDLAGNAVVVWEQSNGTYTRIWSNRYE